MSIASPLSNYIVLVIISGVISTLFAIYAYFNKNRFSGIRFFMWSSALTAVYAFSNAFELASDSLQEIRFWLNIEYFGMPFIAPCSLLFVMHYIGLDSYTTRKRLWIWFVIPVITLIMHTSNDYHHLFYKLLYLRPDTPKAMAGILPGKWYFVHGSYTFALVCISLFLIFRYWKTTKAAYRKHLVTLSFGISLPAAGSLMYLLGLTPIGMDPVPIVMGATTVLYAWAITSSGMLTVNPIAHEHIFESMRDGVLVLNLANQILDYNSAAARIIPALNPSTIGKKLEHVWQRGAESGAFAFSNDQAMDYEQELKWIKGKETQYFRIRSSQLLKPNGQIVGRTIVMVDVTEHTLLQKKLRHLAEIDGLTSVYNRTTFMEKSRERLKQAHLSQEPLSLILFDIDFFKQTNDQYGHHVGDLALQHIADICLQLIHPNDLLGRYGGEEFAVCLSNSSLAQAYETADLIRRQIADTPLLVSSKPISLTASFGVTEATKVDIPLEILLQEADTALYRSKNRGRNTVSLASKDHIHVDG